MTLPPSVHILPDVLRPHLQVVFCGTAAGTRSAERRAYYAGPGNKFWRTLHRLQLTPRLLLPHEFVQVLDLNIGLTDLAKVSFGPDASLSRKSFDTHSLIAKITKASPRILAFNGKKAAQILLGKKSLTYGLQTERIDSTLLYVLPSTSGAANGEWKHHSSAWDGLADALQIR